MRAAGLRPKKVVGRSGVLPYDSVGVWGVYLVDSGGGCGAALDVVVAREEGLIPEALSHYIGELVGCYELHELVGSSIIVRRSGGASQVECLVRDTVGINGEDGRFVDQLGECVREEPGSCRSVGGGVC